MKDKYLNETLDEPEDNICHSLNPISAECAEYDGCLFADVCSRKISQCSLILEIEGKPLPPACQALLDDMNELLFGD